MRVAATGGWVGIPTQVGVFLARATPTGIREIRLPSGSALTADSSAEHVEVSAGRHVEQFGRELREYLAGERRSFAVPLDPEPATSFIESVRRTCAAIPYGETITYAELAERAGFPGRARAAGRAMATNPLPIIIPCHRVIGSSGSLTGYGGGLGLKRWLLDLEAGRARLF